VAIPASREARSYYRCAFQRYDDAQVLQRAEHTTGAVYLAGYGIECILKALILEGQSPALRQSVLDSFRGSHAHDYEWLRSRYLLNGGARFPKVVTVAFTLVQGWSTEMRYLPRTWRADDADAFLAAAGTILRWADGRL
jgi:hypothetical protein